MKSLILYVLLFLSLNSEAQVTKVAFTASGLTCSMCSNSIEKAVKSLGFVDKVQSNIKTYVFEVTFKNTDGVDFDKIRKKVEGAGFSISSFTAFIQFTDMAIKEGEPVIVSGQKLVFSGIKPSILNGLKEVKILNKGFTLQKNHKQSDSRFYSAGVYLAAI